MPQFIYLHGFGSSPEGQKAGFFRLKLRSWNTSLRVPDLNVPNFSELTLTSMIERAAEEIKACAPSPVFIIASSLGAAVALNVVSRLPASDAGRIRKMLFLAPSLDFVEGHRRKVGIKGLQRWKAAGHAPFRHHSDGRTVKVKYGLVEDLQKYDSYQAKINTPILIIHGYEDRAVPYEFSVRFAASAPNVILQLVNSNHRLLDQLDYIWSSAVQFFALCEDCPPRPDVKIQSYDLSAAAQREGFAPYREIVLGLLKSAYAERYYGPEVHLKRLYGETTSVRASHVILALSEQNRSSKLVGCSYLRPDGKRCAIAVSPEHQGSGIGRLLVCESLKYFPHQVSEIESSDIRMKRLLQNVGFTCVRAEEDLFACLGSLKALVTSVHHHGKYLSYTRVLPNRLGALREFVMLKYEKQQLGKRPEPERRSPCETY